MVRGAHISVCVFLIVNIAPDRESKSKNKGLNVCIKKALNSNASSFN